MMPLTKVTDMSYERSVPGRIFGYGRFVMESAGQDQALHKVNWVPDPDHHYRAICAEIFGVGERNPFDDPYGDPDDRLRRTGRPLGRPPSGGGGPRERGAGGGLPDPYAGWDDPRHSPAAPTSPTSRAQGSLYRSPDLRARDRSADTGPIPLRPRRRVDQDD